MKKLILLYLLFIISSAFSYAQDMETEKLKLNITVAEKFYDDGNYNSAITSYIAVLNDFNEIISDSLHFELNLNIANSFYLTGNFNKAIYHYSNCTNIYSNVSDTIELIKIYRKIGISYRKLKLYEKSQKFYSDGLSLAYKINSKKSIADIYISLGNLFREKHNYLKAKQYFEQSVQIGKETKDTLNLAINYVNFAELAYLSKEYDSAIYYLEKSLKCQKFLDHKFLDSGTYLYLAKSYQKKENYILAEMYLNQTIEIETASYSPKRLVTAFKLMSDIFQEQKKFEQANIYLQKYASLNDSILSEENKDNTVLYESLQKLQHIESENNINSEKLARYKTIYLFVSFASLLLILIIILLIRNRTKIKAFSNEILKRNRQIAHQNEEIKQQNEEMTQQNEELSVHKENLQEIVYKKTEDLEIALEKAEESNCLKASFLKNISHEVRTPMNAIVGFAQLLTYNDKDPNHKYIEIIDKHIHELLKLIDHIIEMSRIQAQQIKIFVNNFFVKELFDELYISSLQFSEKKNKSHISIYFEGIKNTQEEINSDKDKIFIILYQLVENAIKYTEKGNVKLSYTKGNGKAIFKLVDTGIGIEDEKIDKIFESFVKIEKSEKLYRGTGLGLAIVKNLVDILKGEISIKSEIGKGTSFTISIPDIKQDEIL
ncbi:MAG: hypothetical protein DRJ07_17115 [Bacteroidetes bacterium]|nr:MAG: hypothetical protein DRJ07_17115 [Bacteroidota bacterium]